MDSVLVTVLIAACGGISLVAYRHPQRFKVFGIAVTAIMFVLLALLIAYRQGLNDALTHDRSDLAERYEFISHAQWAMLAFLAYAAFLEFLPKLLKLPKQDRSEDE